MEPGGRPHGGHREAWQEVAWREAGAGGHSSRCRCGNPVSRAVGVVTVRPYSLGSAVAQIDLIYLIRVSKGKYFEQIMAKSFQIL